MASGSTAPFSGEFVDLENVPKLPEGISAEQVLEQNSDVIRQAAEARFNAGLSQVNADGGFFDAFVNESKTASLSGAVIGNNLVAKLGKNTVVLDDFESGISSTWAGDTGSFTTTTNRVLDGSQSAVLESNSSFLQVDYVETGLIDSSDEELIFLVELDNKGSTNSDSVLFRFKQNGSIIDKVEFFDNGSLDTFTASSSWKVNTTYKVIYRGVSSSETRLIVKNIDDGQTKIDEKLGSFNNLDELFFYNDTNNDGINRKLFFDGFVRKQGLKSSGTLTEEQFTFTDTQGNSFSPSKVGIFPEQTLNGQSITYDLKDSTGTVVKTFNQADLNQLQSVNTTDTTFQVEANFSGNGSQTPELEFLDVRGV